MALADMLWDEDEQIPAEVRYALAKLFEPRFGRGRKLKFTRGRRKNVDLELAATRFIYRAVKRGATVNEAMKSAEDYFGLGRENIRKIWKTHKPFEVRLHGALPPARRGRKKK
jgi:hypothetical protein